VLENATPFSVEPTLPRQPKAFSSVSIRGFMHLIKSTSRIKVTTVEHYTAAGAIPSQIPTLIQALQASQPVL
jgi:hypothetical protein